MSGVDESSRRSRKRGRTLSSFLPIPDLLPRRGRSKAPGAAPGTLVADPEAQRPRISVLAYGPDSIEESEVESVAELAELAGRYPVTWINVDGIGDPEMLEQIGRLFGLHPLAVEDVNNTGQRVKVEVYDEHLFIVFRMALRLDAGTPGAERRFDSEQLALFVQDGLVVTFQEQPGDCLDPVRDRVRRGGPRLRTMGAGYLAYALLDAVIDGYFPVLEQYESAMETIEERILEEPGDELNEPIHQLRRDLIALRRIMRSHEEVVSTLLREPLVQLPQETRVFLRDTLDHAARLSDQVESYREVTSSLMDTHLSALSKRTNDAMQVLTVIATIFIPLSFITGLYGMNFDTGSPYNMPELSWRFGYPAVLGGMVAMLVGLLWYFRRKGWFS